MPSVKLTRGTIETVPVDLEDITGVLNDLSGLSPKFDVLDDANVSKYTAQTATGVLMRINCLINTSATHPGGLWAIGHYRLYVSFTNSPETPRLGPIDLHIYDTN